MKQKTAVRHPAFILFFTINLMNSVFPVQDSIKDDGNWPSFRGRLARGISDGYTTPVSWSIEDSINVKWKTPIPGLGHSSPIVWEDRIIVTTAVSGRNNSEEKSTLDENEYMWNVYCLDKKSGQILWERTACRGVPNIVRHLRTSHANSTPVTDGKHIVVFFGTEGLYCYNMHGKLLWKKDFSYLDNEFLEDSWANYRFASSPVIHEGVVILQCDVKVNSFLAALDINTGNELWRTPRDEISTWCTPSVLTNMERTEIIVNGFKHIGGYDYKSGNELWRMGLDNEGTVAWPVVPTPVIDHNMIIITSAMKRKKPIFAVKLHPKGDISLRSGERSNEAVVWSWNLGGSYLSTPLIYSDYVYNLMVSGQLICYRVSTGEMVYRNRLRSGGDFIASSVASDGKLYFTGGRGIVFIVKAGPDFELLSTNRLNDECVSTPAISEGTLYFRTYHYLIAITKNN